MNIYINTNDIANAVAQFKGLLLNAKDKGVLNLSYTSPKPYKPNRSNQQNKYLWGVVYKSILDHFVLTGNYGYTSEDMHDFLKGRYLAHKGKVIDDGESVMVVGVKTSRLNKEEFSEYVNNIKAWALDKLGIEIPESDV